jgi:hypothetical protein
MPVCDLLWAVSWVLNRGRGEPVSELREVSPQGVSWVSLVIDLICLRCWWGICRSEHGASQDRHMKAISGWGSCLVSMEGAGGERGRRWPIQVTPVPAQPGYSEFGPTELRPTRLRRSLSNRVTVNQVTAKSNQAGRCLFLFVSPYICLTCVFSILWFWLFFVWTK